MKTVQEWINFCHKNGSNGLISADHDVMDAVFDILNDWEQSEKNLCDMCDINESAAGSTPEEPDSKEVKRYEFGIAEVGPTDCTLFITDGETHKVFGIDSESWKRVSSLIILGAVIAEPGQYSKMDRAANGSGEISDDHDAASIARQLLYSDTSEDEI